MTSLFAAEERHAKRERLGNPLQVLDRAIDFAALARAVDAKLVIGDSGRGDRPPYPTELYNLSDEALEYQLLDRASFQRFAGLEKSSRIPDAKTVWVWRERLKKQDLIGDLSEAVGRQLAQAGFITNPYQYTGRENDGTGLYYYRARYYSPGMARFVSEDPITFAGGQNNFYAYVGGNPLTGVDPLGLAWQLVIGGGGTVIVPFFGGGLNFNIGINIDGWHSSAYIQDQANLGAPGAGGAFVGAGLNLSLTHAEAPTTGFDSEKYFEADAGYFGGLGVSGTENGCHGIDLSSIKGIKPGVGMGLGAFVGTTYTSTAVSPTIGSLFGY